MSQLALHLDAIEAQLRLALAQVSLARELTLGAAPPPLPARCASVPSDRCALLNPDARVDVGGMGGAAPVWVCRGCGEGVE